MNYLNIYINLIKTRQLIDRSCLPDCEKHHILPESIFNAIVNNIEFNVFEVKSLNCDENIVKLTQREHYIAHLLLVKIFKNKNTNCYERMLYSANFMANRTKNSNEYSWLKKEHSKKLSETLKGKPSRAKGCKWSEARRKLGVPWVKGKTYEQIYGVEEAKKLKKLRSVSQKGRKHKKETIDRLSKIIRGKEWREKISKSKSGIPLREEVRLKIKAFFNDPNKNTSIDRTLYKFYHIDGREIISTKYDMKKKYDCKSIHKLISGERKYCMGWFYKGDIIKS